MPPTLASLQADRSLGLRVLSGAQSLDRPVAWVHVSELIDPAPFLEGGELLLTTGLTLGEETDWDGFVGRLADCGIAALGFGVGLSHDTVPPGLVRAAEHAGLPLLEVPRRTPFIAISKAASAAIAADAYSEVTRTNAAQRELTRAALGKAGKSGAASLVRRLAKLLDAWVLLLDAGGAIAHAAPAAATGKATHLSAEIERLRGKGGPASASVEIGGEWVSAQVLGGRPPAILVVGTGFRLGRADQHVVNSAAALLTLALARSAEHEAAQRRLRTGLLRLVLAGHCDVAGEAANELWGPLPAEPVLVLCASGARQARDEFVDLLAAGSGQDGWFFADFSGHLVVLASEQDQVRVESIAERVAGLRLGVSEPVPYASAGEGYRQAEHAAGAADGRGISVLRHGDLAGRGLLGLLDRSASEAFAQALLAPLIEHDATGRGDLVDSLHEWLRRHGQWDPAAAQLGVHRHTLRNRIAKAEQLLGASLDDPGVRAELWLALQATRAAARDDDSAGQGP